MNDGPQILELQHGNNDSVVNVGEIPALTVPANLPRPITPVDEFTLKAALNDAPHLETMWRILTRVVKEELVEQIKDLEEDISTKILSAFRVVHVNVIDKANFENRTSFSIHTAVDPLFESFTNTKIFGKSHAEKALNHYNSIVNAIIDINKYLYKKGKKEKGSAEALSETQEKLIRNSLSFLKIHHNAYVYSLQQLDIETKNELLNKKIKIIKDETLYLGSDKQLLKNPIDRLKFYVLTADELNAINSFIPQTPSPHKKPLGEKRTPDALTPNKKRSLSALKLAEEDVNPRRKSARRRLDNLLLPTTPEMNACLGGSSTPPLLVQFSSLGLQQEITLSITSENSKPSSTPKTN